MSLPVAKGQRLGSVLGGGGSCIPEEVTFELP